MSFIYVFLVSHVRPFVCFFFSPFLPFSFSPFSNVCDETDCSLKEREAKSKHHLSVKTNASQGAGTQHKKTGWPAGHGQFRVNDVFCAVSLSGTLQILWINVQKNPPLAATQAFTLRTQALPIILDHAAAACSTCCDTRVPKVPAILRDWKKQDAERAALCARSTKRSRREKGLERTLIETQPCSATLSCIAHKPACWRAMAGCPRSINVYVGDPRGLRNWAQSTRPSL